MNVRFLNPFVEAAFEVLSIETGLTAARGELTLEKQAYITDDVTVMLSLVGDVEGIVFYSLSQTAALSLSSKMLGETMLTFDGLAQSGIAELGNVITGRASVKLADAGFEATISPPTLLCGRGATLSTLDFARIVVPLQLDCGNLVIHLALRASAAKVASAAALATPARPSLVH
jgi:chemotaxis protein CheX